MHEKNGFKTPIPLKNRAESELGDDPPYIVEKVKFFRANDGFFLCEKHRFRITGNVQFWCF
jgi:hypothetical protein